MGLAAAKITLAGGFIDERKHSTAAIFSKIGRDQRAL